MIEGKLSDTTVPMKRNWGWLPRVGDFRSFRGAKKQATYQKQTCVLPEGGKRAVRGGTAAQLRAGE